MRRVYQFLLILFVAGMVLLVLYAAPLTRPWMETTLGPPVSAMFGTVYTFAINSPPALFLLANPIWLFIIGIVLGIFPVSFPIIHRSFNTVRGKAVGSAMKESTLYAKQKVHTHVATQVAEKPEKTTTQPIPPVAPAPKEEKVKPEAENTE